jgi:diazepam-binding inhibitor (GABA receptor modulating acyl-CoA-binding protein)
MSRPASEAKLLFDAAVRQVQNGKKRSDISNDDQLKVYALYKQATQGDNATEQPSFFDFTTRAKWDSWTQLKGMSKDKAKLQYAKLIRELA